MPVNLLNTRSSVTDDASRSVTHSRRPSGVASNIVAISPEQQMADVVSRHLVNPSDKPSSDSFNPLQLQGGDITRELYRWQDHNQEAAVSDNQPGRLEAPRHRRSISFSGSVRSHGSIPNTEMSAEQIRAPQGFRRSFLVQKSLQEGGHIPTFVARNFFEFLTLYGHFAGQDLSEDEDEDIDQDQDVAEDEETALVGESPAKRRAALRAARRESHKSSTFKAVLLLVKSFVGTGVLFLPRAFHNGGWAFSTFCLLLCGIVSYYCFVILISTKNKLNVKGYGDLGGSVYGHKMELAILGSIVLSQIGFVAAYAVFTATNLQVFFANVFHWEYSLTFWLLVQLALYLPLSLTRNIAKLSGTALLADLFILLGLLYVYYYCGQFVVHHGIASESMLVFNKNDWTLFIGTAIFTYEGIGLLIPIQESMKHPEKFNKCLFGVMASVTIIFVMCGLLCYSAFGDRVKIVILLNFPRDSAMTATVQLLYALAILLSTPLQLFPTIRILETSIFPKNASGKYNPRVKWLKNYFRVAVVLANMGIAWLGANDLDKFVSLVGSFACIPLIYIYPPLLHYKAFSKGEAPKSLLAIDLAIAIFGTCVMTYTTYQAVYLWFV
ncbi:LANO_0H09318g1_1 [Lachancea nothofagi CBS 11611]|uniref:LANO_0H09318g1_1 n=1 Tax=Lachancea nothofagi CBS 11611 TaxID=1266666 RepID=A0A1G4KM25_9SACH|nr:LANO_0H09318g1_1 [Lachancea nothofagi CBS 11611]